MNVEQLKVKFLDLKSNLENSRTLGKLKENNYDLNKLNETIEIYLKNIQDRNNSDSKSHDLENRPYWRVIQTTDTHIYVLFYTGETDKVIYSTGTIPELQEWDWQGNLIRRILFDKKYDLIAVSESGILYAIDTINEFNNQIYSYDL